MSHNCRQFSFVKTSKLCYKVQTVNSLAPANAMKRIFHVIPAMLVPTLFAVLAQFAATNAAAQCTPPPPGLVGWWSGENNPIDNTGTNNGALSASGATYAAGKVGQGFRFDGTNGFVQIPDSNSLKPTSVTLEAWVWLDPSLPTNRGGESIIFKKNTWLAWFEGYSLLKATVDNGNGTFSERFEFTVSRTGTQATIRSQTLAQRGVWYHVAATYDGNQSTLFVNGIVEATTTAGFALDYDTTPVFIGTSGTWEPYLSMFGGIIDEPTIYSRALTTNEIAAIYSAGSAGKCGSPVVVSCTPAPANLVAWLRAEGNLNDAAGANNGTQSGGVTFSAGEVGQGLFFNGSSQVKLSASPSINVGAGNGLTLETWLRPGQFTVLAPQLVFEWNDGAGNFGVHLALSTDHGVGGDGFGNVYVNVVDTLGNSHGIWTATNAIVTNAFQHVAFAYDKTSGLAVIYVNGLPAASTNLGSFTPQTSYDLYLGNRVSGPFAGSFFNGQLDEPSIYNRALTTNEIIAIYNAGSAGKCVAPLAPLVVAQPTNLTVTVNNTAVFNVSAQGAAPLYYQWNFNGTNILGATNTTLTLNNVSPAQAGNYSVLISNFVGVAVSSNAVLNVFVPPTPPTIISQTPSQVVLLGNPATFIVNAGGSTPFSYFWFMNNVLISGATNFSYAIPSAQFADSGLKFSCIVSNAYGTAASTNATLKVIDTIANDLCSGAIIITNASYTNAQSTLHASSYGDPLPDCVDGFGNGVWYQFTAPVGGLLKVDTYGSDFDTGLAIYAGGCGSLTQVGCNDDMNGVTSALTIPTTAGVTYYFLIGGYTAHVGNLVFHLNHFTPPVFDVPPTNIAVVVSSNGTFSTTLSGTQPIALQWFFNNAPLADGGRITGVTNATLNIANVNTNDGGNYFVVASNWVGVTTSSVAVLMPVILPPFFLVQPSSQSVLIGSNVTFSAAIDGTPPYAYQWYFNSSPLADDGVHIFGSTTSSLSLSNLVAADGGYYNLVVTNVAGMAVSVDAVLTVMVPPTILTQPVGRSVPPGLPTTFNFTASGNPIPSYHWLLNGTNVPGANTGVYTIPSVGTNQIGFYQVVASNSAGMATSSVAQLTFGPVAAWGRNLNNESLPPPNLSGVVAIAGNSGAGFAVRTNGLIVSWGRGSFPAATNIPPSATNIVAISTQADSGVALRADGTVVGWNAQIPVLSNIVSVAAGGNNFGLALRAEGTVTNWGVISYGAPPAGLGRVIAIAAGYTHSLALRSDGTVAGWGVGVGTNVPAGLSGVTAIAAGYSHGLALKTNGTVVAWGSGAGTNLPAGLTNITAIAASSVSSGQTLVLAIRANGTIVAWGDNLNSETNVPAALGNLISVALAPAPFHGLAMVNDGTPQIIQPPVGLTANLGRDVTLRGVVAGAAPLNYQWLLNGTNITNATNSILPLLNVQSANAGGYQLFASNSFGTAISLPAPVNVISNGTLTFLSQNTATPTNLYQGGKFSIGGITVLGNGPLRYQWFYARTNFAPYTAIAGATNDTLVKDPALALDTGNYYVAVSNLVGGITSAPVAVRVLFARGFGYGGSTNPPVNMTNAIALATGGTAGNTSGHYLAIGADGKVTAWANYSQTSGFSGETNLSALSNSIVTAIAASLQHTLALKSDGTVFVTGTGATNPPAGLNGVTAIACGTYHDLALKSDGTVVGWISSAAVAGQSNYGQATNYPPATNVVAIAAGQFHSLALRADGSVIGWGNSSDGSLNIPFTTTNATLAIGAGNGFGVALRTNGTVVQWGNGIASYPVPSNLSNVVAISASGTHVTALKNNGTVVTWGYEYIGFAASNLPPDLTNVIAIASGGDHDVALFGTRAPVFTVQPWNRTVTPNPGFVTTITLAGRAAGVQPMSYQWRLNGTNYPGATNDTFAWRDSQHPAGTYQLVASNAYGVAISKPAKVTIVIPLSVALDTANNQGISLFNWLTSGNATWFGQTNYVHPDITRPNLSAARSGGIGGSQETILQTTLVTNNPSILSFWWKVSSEQFFDVLEFRVNGTVQASISGEVDWQPINVSLAAGTNLLQWRYAKDGSFDSGLDAAFVDQVSFVLSPAITVQPAPATRTNYAGTLATFTASASGTSPLSYQWQKNGVNLVNGGNVTGATSQNLALGNVQLTDAASYRIVVSNFGGSITSSPASLVVLADEPLITRSPSSRTNNAGTTASFTVTANGLPTLNYQWLKNGFNLADGGNVSGSTTATLVLSDVQDADVASYVVAVTNAFGSVTSAPALLTVVGVPPVITSQPAGITVLRGKPANFSVSATGSKPFSYQWQFGGTNLAGATNAALNLENAGVDNAGAYQVLVANNYGSVTSSIATLSLVHTMIVAWGDNSTGQTNVPGGLPDVKAIAAGSRDSVALLANGHPVSWGQGDGGITNVPPDLFDAAAVAAGSSWQIALKTNGTLVGWSAYGTDLHLAGLSNVTAIAAGWSHWLALKSNGSLETWNGSLNSYTLTNLPSGLTNVTAIAAGLEYSLARKSDGTVVAWGWNVYGQTNVPPGLSNVVAIAASCGSSHSLALRSDGTVVAWGANGSGQTDVPPGLSNIIAIAVGGVHSMALKADGTVVAWGANGVSDPDNGQAQVPAGLSNVVAIAAGGYHSLALVSDGIAAVTPLTIVSQPSSLTTNLGASVVLTVTALGQAELNYQWWHNGAPVGSNSPVLPLANIVRAQAGVYYVTVTNGTGSAISSNAIVKVLVPQILGKPTLLPNGSLQLTSTDVGGGTLTDADLANFEAQASTNLVNWVTLSNGLSLTNGMLQLQDSGQTNYPARYYRIIEH